MKRLTLSLGLLALAATLAACAGTSANNPSSPATPAGSPSGDAVTIVAKDIKFTTPAVAAKAEEAFTIAFDNQDGGVPHNIVITDQSGSQVFKGEIVTGVKVDYHVPALAAGSYSFMCKVHPEMKGTLTVQ
jgi:plastocyanin